MLGFTKSSVVVTAGVVAVALFVATPTARAAAISFNVSANSPDGPVAASADFTTFDNGDIRIVLTNLLSPDQIVSAGQALSDIMFLLSNDAGTVGATSASGQLGTFGTDSTVTYVAGDPDRWLGVGGGQFSVTGATVLLEAIGGGTPDQMILPFIPEGSSYPNDNSGVQNFIPYVIGPATFVLNLSGVTSSTTVLGATFSFGTGPDFFTNAGAGGGGGGGQTVPEPASLALFGVAMFGLAYRARRNR